MTCGLQSTACFSSSSPRELLLHLFGSVVVLALHLALIVSRYTNREAANEKAMADARARLQALQGKNKRLYAAYRSLRCVRMALRRWLLRAGAEALPDINSRTSPPPGWQLMYTTKAGCRCFSL